MTQKIEFFVASKLAVRANFYQEDMTMSNSKRKQLTINLGIYHDQWLTISNEIGVKPATLASAVIKAAIDEHKQQQQGNIEKKSLESFLPPKGAKKDVRLYLNDDELAAVDRMAEQLGKNRNQTLIAIIRSYVANEPQYTQDEIIELRNANNELRKIGVNLNQIALHTNTIDFDRITDGKSVKELLKNFTKRAETISITIDNHVAKVWKLINAGRYRKDLIQGKGNNGK